MTRPESPHGYPDAHAHAHGTPTVGSLGAEYYTLTPCRVIDTREAAGPWGGPALAAGATRAFAIAERREIPVEADAVAVT